MATRLSRQMILKLTLAAMLVCMIVLALFTVKFAPLLSLPGFILSCLLILFWISFAWAVNYARIMSLMSARLFKPGSRWASFTVGTGAGIASLLVGAVGIGWMFYAQAKPPGAAAQTLHWWGQAILLVVFAFVFFKFFITVKKSTTEDTGITVVENAGKRDKLIHEIQSLATSPWLASFEKGSSGNRLRASLTWLEEEIKLSLPEHGFVLAESAVSFFLEEQWRMLTFIKDLGSRNERNDDQLSEAERRVLESINKSTRVARKIAA
jgi:hypothetical protein